MKYSHRFEAFGAVSLNKLGLKKAAYIFLRAAKIMYQIERNSISPGSFQFNTILVDLKRLKIFVPEIQDAQIFFSQKPLSPKKWKKIHVKTQQSIQFAERLGRIFGPDDSDYSGWSRLKKIKVSRKELEKIHSDILND
jgi:hypothetical protein